MRVFIGIDIEDRVRNSIAEIQSIVKEKSKKGRFKYPGNFHITLKFLGDISREDITIIDEVLEDCSDNYRNFCLGIDEMGCFRRGDSIHALWLGFGSGVSMLKALQNYIEEKLELKGFKRETRPYTPHITIAQALILRGAFEDLKKEVLLDTISSIEVKDFSLIKSEQVKGKRIYTPISTYKLLTL